MENNNSPKMKALLQLRQMVEELINDDFKSDKMPKLMALKVTKVTPLANEDKNTDEGMVEMTGGDSPSLSESIKSAAEPCPTCGEMDCDCDPMTEAPKMEAIKVESPGVMKLKKLLGK